MKVKTTTQLFDLWYAKRFPKGPRNAFEVEDYYQMKQAWLAGRKEGMRYPHGRKASTWSQYA